VGYHRRSNAETALFRYKQILGPCLTPRLPDTQITEDYIGVSALKRINKLGLPKRATAAQGILLSAVCATRTLATN
jgi:hypothetical protein